MRPRTLFTSGPDGYELWLDQEERALVLRLLGELRELVTTDAATAGPLVSRLFPTAHADDADREAEYQHLMRDELVASRVAGIAVVESAFAAAPAGKKRRPASVVLTEQELLAFMQALNGVRLVLGTVLDVNETDDPAVISPELVPELQLYGFLSWMLDSAVDALSPEPDR